MKLIQAKDYQDMSRKAANIIAAQMILKPDSVLGLATGSTPIGIYSRLVEMYGEGNLDFSKIRTVNLDEYQGLDAENEQSYRYFMDKHLFSQVNLPEGAAYLPDGRNREAEAECRRYEDLIEALGGIDLQLLGLGHNGHIGFNEPADSFAKGVHLAALTEQTRKANERFFQNQEEMPRYAYTMGVGTIFGARKILLVVSGADKADALDAVLNGPITPRVPGSVLQLHSDVTVVADEAAFSANRT